MRNYSTFVFYAIITVLLFSVESNGQEHYFNYRGKQKPLTISKDKISIIFKRSTTDQQITFFANELSAKQNTSLQKGEREKLCILCLNEAGNLEPLIEDLKKREEIDFVDYVYLSPKKK